MHDDQTDTVPAPPTPTVWVEATAWHTYEGQAYEIGDRYEAPLAILDTLETRGMAKRVE
jgi:hypothetical protein